MTITRLDGYWCAQDGGISGYGRTEAQARAALEVERGYSRMATTDSPFHVDEERKAALNHRGEP